MVEDGVVPGLLGFEAGQSAVGDIFAWFVETAVPAAVSEEAEQCGITVQERLEEEAARLRPGESGLLALDWWNGNRSILVDAELRGLLLGMTLATTPFEIYRALIEATAFGTRVIVDAFESAGVPVESVIACGGLARAERAAHADLRRRARPPDHRCRCRSRRRHSGRRCSGQSPRENTRRSPMRPVI